MSLIRWFRRQPAPKLVIAPEFVELLAATRRSRPTITEQPPAVDEQLVERVAALTAEVAALRQAVDRLESQP